MEQTADEIKRLQGCINDLISLLALPAIWSGHEPSQIVSTLLDVLLGMLRLDFAYVSETINGSPIEVLRVAQRRNLTAQPQEVGRALTPWLTSAPPTSPLMVPNPVGEGEVSIVRLRLGLQDDVGVLVAGSQRADFPTEIERLLLRVAANQAAIALQEARYLSEQRRAAEEIRFQAGLLDAVDQAVIATDTEGIITYWNRFAEGLYGWCAPEVIGRNILDVTRAQGSPRAAAEMRLRWQHGERWTGECLVQHRDGRNFPVLVTDSPIYNSQEGLIGVVRISLDITERKRAEEELEHRVVERTRQLTAVNEELRKEIIERKRAEQALTLFRSLIDHTNDTIEVIDPETGRFLDVNEQACRAHGYTREEYLTLTVPEIDPLIGARPWEETMEEVRRCGSLIMESRHRRKDGSVFPVEVNANYIRLDRDYHVAVVRDITERKRAEEALRQTQAELAHVTRVMTMGALTASIAHEVNQPLAAVVTNGNACLRWLARAEPDLEEARAAVERIIRDGQRASEVIRRMRALAQKTDHQKAWLDLNDVICEVVALMHSEVRQQRVVLRTELSAALPPVLGDRVQLQQVILNLLINGIEGMQAVTDRPREVRIRSQRHEADTVLVAVQDTGIGLDPQQMARLFDAFFTTKPGGMGMGLAISRTIIEAHGGRLWASPNMGPGATFQFTLPLTSACQS
jgi:PAS domain S-box-containing protein